MKKVLIFYGSYGGGHLSAARAINEYIKNNDTDIETMMVDCIEYINKFVNKITTKAYSDMAKRAPWAWGYIYKKSEKGIIAKFSNDSNKLMAYKLNKLNEWDLKLPNTKEFSSFNLKEDLSKKTEAVEGSSK